MRKIEKLRLDKKSWEIGFEAGRRQDPNDILPQGVEVLSYRSGYIEGKGQAEAKVDDDHHQ